MRNTLSSNVRTVLGILQDEVDGNVTSALQKMTKDYSMTWVDAGIDGTQLFPTTTNDMKAELEAAYPIRGRQYDIRNIAEGRDLVVLELIETFPDIRTKKVYRTPLVLVLEMKHGKIRTGRHYLDPRLSGRHLTKKQVEKAYRHSKGSQLLVR